MNNNGQRNGRPGNPQRGRPNQNNPRDLTPEEIARRKAYIRRRREAEEARQNAMRENERRRLRREKEMKAAKRKEDLRIFGGRFLVFLVIFLVFCAIVGLIFWAVFRHTPDEPKDTGKIIYFYGGEEVRSSSAKDVIVGKNIYFCFNDLSDYLGMSESGSADNMKFILPDSVPSSDNASGSGKEESVIFHTDNYTVTIGGQSISLDIPNILKGDEVWVSSEFITEYMNNLSFSYNETGGKINISRIKDEENSTEDNIVYLLPSFKIKDNPVIPPVDDPNPDSETTDDPPVGPPEESTEDPVNEPEVDPLDAEVPIPEFVNDLSAYEKYMNPEDRDGYLILVNTKNHIPESHIPTDLYPVNYQTSWGYYQLREYAAKSLEALRMEMESAGFYNMMILSAYRSYSTQATLFAQYTLNEMNNDPGISKEEAERRALLYSTRPGTSEHQTGLAVDMDTLGTFTTDFQYEPEYKWLSENAWKFGFILRFPDGKTPITTIQFEPWHYRFVGRFHAKKIHDLGVCLEEYIEILNQRKQ